MLAAVVGAAMLSVPAGAPPQTVLFAANFSAPFSLVTEAALLDASGSRRMKTPSALDEWVLESGAPPLYNQALATATAGPDGLTLTNNGCHLVLWLNKQFPASSELRFGMEPRNASEGLNIVFFSSAVLGGTGGSIFALDLPPRQGSYANYNNASLQTYSDSYFRPNGKGGVGVCDKTPTGNCQANLRKDPVCAGGKNVIH
jgi:hypothetical protein